MSLVDDAEPPLSPTATASEDTLDAAATSRTAAVDLIVRLGWTVPLALFLVGLLIPWLGINPTWVRIAALSAIFGLIVSGINLTWGYAGELSLGQAAVFAVGAYVSAYMSLHGVTDMFAQLAAASAAGAFVGLVVGLPGLRVSGLSFAMTSFFLVLLIPSIASLTPSITGGFTGLFGIPGMTFFGHPVDGKWYVFLCLLLLGLWLMFMRSLVLSEYGRAFDVLRASPVLAESLGIPVVQQKLKAYVLGSVPAAMAGFLFTHLDGFVAPNSFGFDIAVGLIAASVIGGNRSIYGAVIGAFLLQIGPYLTASFTGYSLIIYGALLLIGAVLTSGGLAAIGSGLLHRGLVLLRGSELRTAPVEAPAGGGRTSVHASHRELQPERVEVREVSMSFGGVKALTEVSLDVVPGRITALIGPNGSGKTTLLNILSGMYRAEAGHVEIGDQRLDHASAHRCYSLGVSRTFQTPRIPSGLTTVDAIATGAWSADPVGIVRTVLRTPGSRRTEARHRSLAYEYLAGLGLADIAWRDASSLPLGLRRLVEVGRAGIARPRLLLLDEPASGLSTTEIAQLKGVLERVTGTTIATLLVEHNVEFVKSVAQYVYVLDGGRLIAEGPPAEVMRHPAVIESYMGKVH